MQDLDEACDGLYPGSQVLPSRAGTHDSRTELELAGTALQFAAQPFLEDEAEVVEFID